MLLESSSFADGAPIPGEFALGLIDPDTHVGFAPNRNPHLVWADLPVGTQSVVLTCVDIDVPTVPDDVNQEGREVPVDLPRADFVHWVLVDVPPGVNEIGAGEFSAGVTPRGKDGTGPHGRQGVNDYTSWFSGDADMAGTYLGYDGPGPPWNDARIHRYRFTVTALEIPSLPVSGSFSLDEVRDAMEGHVLGQASMMGTYTLNPRLAAQD
jgi:Raf kinase inhibitor-like YbhB/YbcL family protein